MLLCEGKQVGFLFFYKELFFSHDNHCLQGMTIAAFNSPACPTFPLINLNVPFSGVFCTCVFSVCFIVPFLVYFINCFVLFKCQVFFYCILIVKFDSMRSSSDCDVFIFIFEIMNKPFYLSIYIYLFIYLLKVVF